MRLEWIAVGFGGALGSVARHGVNIIVARWLGSPVPYATLAVNLLGCAAIGLLAGGVASERLSMTPTARVFVFVGILGGFTTFSSFGLDTLTLVRTGRVAAALGNVAAQVGVGLAAVAIGYWTGLFLWRASS
jgi:CrcB protein